MLTFRLSSCHLTKFDWNKSHISKVNSVIRSKVMLVKVILSPMIGPWKRTIWDSGFQISKRPWNRIQISIEWYYSYFIVAAIQDSNFKRMGFKIQIMSSMALMI